MMMKSMRKQRMLAMGIVFCMVIVFVLSVSFVILHTDHDCTGSDCNICHELSVCLASLQRLADGIGGASIGMMIACSFLSGLLFVGAGYKRQPRTLVCLKVRLNN